MPLIASLYRRQTASINSNPGLLPRPSFKFKVDEGKSGVLLMPMGSPHQQPILLVIPAT
jgi:hypothetical protein